MNNKTRNKILGRALATITQLGRCPYITEGDESDYSRADMVCAGILNICHVAQTYGLEVTKEQWKTLLKAVPYLTCDNFVVFTESAKGLWAKDLLDRISHIRGYFYIQETIDGWRQRAIFKGTLKECKEYYMDNYLYHGNYAIVHEEEYEEDYL
jgi:hypothetical protein